MLMEDLDTRSVADLEYMKEKAASPTRGWQNSRLRKAPRQKRESENKRGGQIRPPLLLCTRIFFARRSAEH
jgi:hypothetical protein